ncbi:MAG: chemotaxis-specific protein-glutamate methyltransferase CheB [Clostridiales bacterium]|nr:chemotaxis-specific protein-glutamate methyltransferase CheB [Clostridiales bacterium]
MRVLIVDDSMLFREALRRELSKEDDIDVVALAVDPFDARDMIMELDPDIMVSDINMPKMNGVDFIERLMPQYPLPTVVVSSNREYISAALKAGAAGGVEKPSAGHGRGFSAFARQVAAEIRVAMKTDRRGARQQPDGAKQPGDAQGARYGGSVLAIAIGASTGGTDAIADVVSALPAGLPGIVIVQHMPADFTGMFSGRLNSICAFPVREAKTGDRVTPGTALVAPGDFQMRVVKNPDGALSVAVAHGEKVSGHCPSVDVLFSSVASSAGQNAIGVILTGMGHDGADGMLEMKLAGAGTIGQDEKTCVVYGMPRAAYEKGAVRYQLPIGQIAAKIVSLANKGAASPK